MDKETLIAAARIMSKVGIEFSWGSPFIGGHSTVSPEFAADLVEDQDGAIARFYGITRKALGAYMDHDWQCLGQTSRKARCKNLVKNHERQGHPPVMDDEEDFDPRADAFRFCELHMPKG